jgi:hypothetical protein
MAINPKTYQPVQSISVEANEDLPAFRFVSHLGTLCSDTGRALGVTEVDWVRGELAQIITLGTIAIETTTSINAGDDITSAIAGKAKAASEGNPVNGRAIDSCTGEGYVRIKLVP